MRLRIFVLLLCLTGCTTSSQPAGSPTLSTPNSPTPAAAIPIRAYSNLTDATLTASAKFSGQTVTSDQQGLMEVSAPAGTELTIAADGYEEKKVNLPAVGELNVVLNATVETTKRQMVEWEKQRLFEKMWDWIHPDAHNYISKAQYIKNATSNADEGYQAISVEILDVTYAAWTFTKCRVNKFGPRKYQSAVIRYKQHQTTPAGGTEALDGAGHYVRTPDGRWRWFPLAGCDFRI